MNEEIISFSEVFKWDSCPRQYYYSFDLSLRPIDVSPTITTGTKGHKLLQGFYESLKSGLSKEEAHAKVQNIAKKLLNPPKNTGLLGTLDIANKAPAFDLLKAWTLVDNYIRDNEFKSEAVLVENRFLIAASHFSSDPIFENIQIGFTPDVVFAHPGNILDVEDSKFVQRAWSKSKINRFPQSKLYQIFLKALGYNVQRASIRFFNVTTAEIKAYSYSLTPDEETNLIYDFMRGAKEVLQHRNRLDKTPPRRTMNYTACQFCPFERPCTLEAEGKSATNTLNSLYVKSDYDYSV